MRGCCSWRSTGSGGQGREGGSRTALSSLTVRYRPLPLQKLLQAKAALSESSGVLHSHVAVMPGLPLEAGLILFAYRIGQDKPVLPSMLLEPPVGARLREESPDLVAGGRVGEVHCGAELMLAVPRRRAHPTCASPEDTH